MADPILLLLLEGPIQSWGIRSRWDVRDTGLEPTKSGVIGLIGCALGLERHDPELEKLDRELLFGVRIDRPGVVSTDYHTVTGYHRTAEGKHKHSGGSAKSLEKAQEYDEYTIVSYRDYLYDASFLVAMAVKQEYRSENRDLLVNLKKFLQQPKWPFFLGRKACVPSRPVLEKLTTEYQDIENALRKEPWAAPRSRLELKAFQRADQAPVLLAWIECPDGEHERQDSLRLNQLRFYGFRRCRNIEIDTRFISWRIT